MVEFVAIPEIERIKFLRGLTHRVNSGRASERDIYILGRAILAVAGREEDDLLIARRYSPDQNRMHQVMNCGSTEILVGGLVLSSYNFRSIEGLRRRYDIDSAIMVVEQRKGRRFRVGDIHTSRIRRLTLEARVVLAREYLHAFMPLLGLSENEPQVPSIYQS